MSPIKYTFWLADQAFGGLMYLWPVTLVLVALCFVALILAHFNHATVLRKSIKFMLLPLMGACVLLVIGAVFKEMPQFIFVPYIGAASMLSLCCFAVFKTKTIWPASLATSSFIAWLTVWFWLVAVMSITGDWM